MSNDFKQKDFCELKHNQLDKEIANILKQIDDIKQEIKELEKLYNNKEDNITNRITSAKASVSSRLDEIDSGINLAFYGEKNTPGLYEKIRTIEKRLFITWGVIAILLGGRFMGINMDGIKEFFVGPKTEQKQIEENSIDEQSDFYLPPKEELPSNKKNIKEKD